MIWVLFQAFLIYLKCVYISSCHILRDPKVAYMLCSLNVACWSVGQTGKKSWVWGHCQFTVKGSSPTLEMTGEVQLVEDVQYFHEKANKQIWESIISLLNYVFIIRYLLFLYVFMNNSILNSVCFSACTSALASLPTHPDHSTPPVKPSRSAGSQGWSYHSYS